MFRQSEKELRCRKAATIGCKGANKTVRETSGKEQSKTIDYISLDVLSALAEAEEMAGDPADDGCIRVTYKTGEFLGRHGSVAASKRAPEHSLPMVGDVILYNENTRQIEPGNGCFGKTPRGIGRVIGYGGPNNCQMFLMIYRRPGCNHRESFLTQDFRTGIYLYRRMTDYVYTVDRYEYEDLDIAHPHADIAQLFADDGNYLVPEEDQIFNNAIRGYCARRNA